MKVIDVGKLKGRRIKEPGYQRTLKKIIETKKITAHLGVIEVGQVTSRHVHEESEEIVYVLKGKGNVTAGDETKKYNSNFFIHLPAGVPHQYRNKGEENLILLAIYSPPASLPKK